MHDHQLIKVAKQALQSEEGMVAEGSPYLIANFETGDVQTLQSKFRAIPMRYDIFNDQIEFKQKEDVYILDPKPDIVKIITSNGSVMVVERCSGLKKGRQFGFFTLLDSGKLSLLVKQVVAFQEAQLPKALESSARPAKYIRMPDNYYFKIGVGEILKIKSIKTILENLPDHQDETAQFAKEKRISAKKVPELLTLAKFYNSLK